MVDPDSSTDCAFPARAASARRAISAASCQMFWSCALRTTGTISPASVCIAMPKSLRRTASLYRRLSHALRTSSAPLRLFLRMRRSSTGCSRYSRLREPDRSTRTSARGRNRLRQLRPRRSKLPRCVCPAQRLRPWPSLRIDYIVWQDCRRSRRSPLRDWSRTPAFGAPSTCPDCWNRFGSSCRPSTIHGRSRVIIAAIIRSVRKFRHIGRGAHRGASRWRPYLGDVRHDTTPAIVADWTMFVRAGCGGRKAAA